MTLEIIRLDIFYCETIANILSTDSRLHSSLSTNSPQVKITAQEYYDGCKAWEKRKHGHNFIITCDRIGIGSISYHRKNNDTAGCGYWIESSLWGKGIGTMAFSKFLPIIQNAGFKYVTANILKDNIASLQIWKKYTNDIKESEDRYTPLIKLV